MNSRVICIGNMSKDQINIVGKISEKQGGPVYYLSKVFSDYKIPHTILGKISNKFNFPQTKQTDFSKIQFHEKDTTILINKNSAKILYYAGAINLNKIPLNFFSKKIIVISTILKDVPIEFIKKIKREKSIIVVDIQGFMRKCNKEGDTIKKRIDLKFFKNINILKLNSEEFNILFKSDLIKMLKEIKKLKIKVVLLSKGKEGLYIYNNKNRKLNFIKNNIILKNIDDTGAGDTLLGSFISNLIQGTSIIKSAENAQRYTLAFLKNKNTIRQ